MPEFIRLNEVVSVPLKQALRHPGAFHHSFLARRTRYPQFCHKDSTQSAEFTSSGLTCRDGQLKLAKMGGSLEAVWSYYLPPNPDSVTVTWEPDGTTLFKVDPTFPSTRTCCAAVTSEPALPLSVRELA
jgi:putative transposase